MAEAKTGNQLKLLLGILGFAAVGFVTLSISKCRLVQEDTSETWTPTVKDAVVIVMEDISIIRSASGDTDSLTEISKRGRYLVLSNYPRAKRQYLKRESVTLVTHASVESSKRVPILCQRWDGPLSISVYVDCWGRELNDTVRVIKSLRSCHDCVMQNVSFHLILNLDNLPEHLGRVINVDAILPPWTDYEDSDCLGEDQSPDVVGGLPSATDYPANVARNVARDMATTRYLMVSDTEFYPSLDVIPSVLRMLSSENATGLGYRVYVLPAYEVASTAPLPNNMRELGRLLQEQKAIVLPKFNYLACDYFHGFELPNKEQPLRDSLEARQDRDMQNSVPIYIGTNDEPFYEETVTWESKFNKVLQVCDMWAMDYTFHTLDEGFLVRTQSAKTTESDDNEINGLRQPF